MRICPHCQTETEDAICANDGYRTVLKPNNASQSDLSGTTFQGRYRIDEKLGSGGMGAVYRATQLSVDRPVALKVIHARLADNLSDVARFQQEARAIAALHHPNIVSLIDFGQADSGELFLVMEHLEGVSLGRLIRSEAPLPVERVIEISRQIFEALHEAHSRDIVHRDMKPENIFVSQIGRKGDFVKLLDFGIAKVNKNEHSPLSTITQTGTIVGSPRYMAPEQARGREVTGQTDLYAVGAMMYEMITGQPVFDAESATDCVIMHVTAAPPRPVVNGEYVSGPLVGLILGLLEKDPNSRPPGAEVCIQQLEEMVEQAMFPVGPADPSDRVRPPSEVLRDGETPQRPDDIPMTMTLGEWRGAMDPTVATPAPLPDIDTRRAITSAELGIKVGEEQVDQASSTASVTTGVPGGGLRWAAFVGVFLVAVALTFALAGGDESVESSSASLSNPSSAGASADPGTQVASVENDTLHLTGDGPTPGPERASEGPLRTPVNVDGDTSSTQEQADVDDPARSTDGMEEKAANPKAVEVKRELISTPKATVLRDGRKIGSTPQVIRWMSNERAPTVKLVRSGYRSLVVAMEASSEGISQRVTMKRKRVQAPKKTTPASKKKSYNFID